MEVKERPDGALYVIHYAGSFASIAETRIERIYYKGAACDVEIPWEKTGCKAMDPAVTHDEPESCPGGSGLARDSSNCHRGWRAGFIGWW